MQRSCLALLVIIATTRLLALDAAIITQTAWKSVTLSNTDIMAVTHVEVVAPTDAFCSNLAQSVYSSTLFCFSQGTCLVALSEVDIIYKRGPPPGTWYCKTSDQDPFMRVGSDGLYYIFRAEKLGTYDEAEAGCTALSPIGTYRIAQAKTSLTLDNMRDFNRELPNWLGIFYIGLERQTDGSLKWADGSDVDMSVFRPDEPKLDNLGSRFVFYAGLVDDQKDSGKGTYLCQANFDGVDW